MWSTDLPSSTPPIRGWLSEGLHNPNQLRKSWYLFLCERRGCPRRWCTPQRLAFFTYFLEDARPPYIDDEIECYVEAGRNPGRRAGTIDYYRASVRQSQKEAVAKLRLIRRADAGHLGEKGFGTSAPTSPSPTATTCRTSTGWSVCLTLRMGASRRGANGPSVADRLPRPRGVARIFDRVVKSRRGPGRRPARLPRRRRRHGALRRCYPLDTRPRAQSRAGECPLHARRSGRAWSRPLSVIVMQRHESIELESSSRSRANCFGPSCSVQVEIHLGQDASRITWATLVPCLVSTSAWSEIVGIGSAARGSGLRAVQQSRALLPMRSCTARSCTAACRGPGYRRTIDGRVEVVEPVLVEPLQHPPPHGIERYPRAGAISGGRRARWRSEIRVTDLTKSRRSCTVKRLTISTKGTP